MWIPRAQQNRNARKREREERLVHTTSSVHVLADVKHAFFKKSNYYTLQCNTSMFKRTGFDIIQLIYERFVQFINANKNVDQTKTGLGEYYGGYPQGISAISKTFLQR